MVINNWNKKGSHLNVKIKNEQEGIFLGMQNETQNLCVTNDHRYVPLVVNTSRSFPHSRLFTEYVPRLARRVPLVEQELPTLPEHLISSPVFSGVHAARSVILYVCFVDRCLSVCTFSFGHCVVCFSSIYWFWLPLWYLQTPLSTFDKTAQKTFNYFAF